MSKPNPLFCRAASQLETYGAQPPIELLRQFMDHGGWYARDNTFRQLVDVQFVGAWRHGTGRGAAWCAIHTYTHTHMRVVVTRGCSADSGARTRYVAWRVS